MKRGRHALRTASAVALALAMSALPSAMHSDQLSEAPQRDGAVQAFLRITNVRLQEPPPSTPQPSTLLTFDLTNDGLLPVTDIKLQVEIHELSLLSSDAPPRAIVRPFEVLGSATIEPGFTVEYSIVFQKFALDCRCEASVTVVSASAVEDGARPGSATLPRKGAI
jgi:hypothetical protein